MTTETQIHPFAGGPHIMGIVNVTPDSFSDGGQFYDTDKAIEHGLKLIKDGATILDIGGESTRPDAAPITPEEEIKRVIPVIEGLKDETSWLSIDTRNADTMEAALKAGANAINDISALTHDPQSIYVAAEAQVPTFLMHMQETPETMQDEPHYNDVVADVYTYLEERIKMCIAHGIGKDLLIADVGIGFGKTLDHNLTLQKDMDHFHELDVPLMLGTSRKSFIAKLCHDEPSGERLGGSLASAIWGLTKGVQVFRVHDVKETVQAFKVFGGCYFGAARG